MEKLMDPKIDARLRTQRVLFVALVSSNAMFAAVAFTAPPAPPPENAVMLIALAAVSVMTLGVSFVLPMVFEKNALASIQGETGTGSDASLPSSFAKHSTARVFKDPRAVLATALERTTTPFILRMALREAVGIYGLVLVFLGHPLHIGLVFMGVSALAQSIEFPRLSRVADALEAATGTSLGAR